MFEDADTGKLIEEIDRYLAAVDLFRAAGCEPSWRPERRAEVPLPLARSESIRTPSDVELH
jgi:hypothetical protein